MVAVSLTAIGAWLGAGCGGSDSATVVATTAEAGPESSTVVPCGTGTTQCGGACVNLTKDPTHCGQCGTVCGAGEACENGACALTCNGGTKKCGTSCVDSRLDPANCGDCNTKCGSGLVCSNSACATSCGTGLTQCGGGDAGGPAFCIDAPNDSRNCGACGNVCATGFSCVAGTCALSCQAGLSSCSYTPRAGDAGAEGGAGDAGPALKICTNLAQDDANCGACGNACAPGQACVAGACSLTCQTGLTRCAAGGDAGASEAGTFDAGAATCANLRVDNTNCGACGTTCAAGQACANGVCTLTCQTGLTSCPADGGSVCTNTAEDDLHCGNCATACAQGRSCVSGVCAVTCGIGGLVCSNQCINPQTDNANCGRCGNACPPTSRASLARAGPRSAARWRRCRSAPT